MFPAQVANLARFRQIGITGRLFATAIRVKVAKGAVTVAIWGHGELVDMVLVRALIRQSPEIGMDPDSNTT